MVSFADTLSIIGIVFEFASVLLIAYRAFYPWRYEDRKMKRLEDKCRTTKEMLTGEKWIGLASMLLLSIGLLLQVVGLLID